MFAETRPFHTFPPNLHPPELMELLNLYLTVGAEAIHNQTRCDRQIYGQRNHGAV